MGIEVAIAAAGTLISAAGAVSQGAAARRAAEMEAQAAEVEARQRDMQARMADLQGREEALEARRDLDRVQAMNAVRGGAAVGASPTFSLIEDFNQGEADRDIDTMLFNARMESTGYRVAARNSLISAGAARKAGRSAYRQGLFRAAGTLAGGGLDIYRIRPGTLSAPSTSGAAAP